MPKRAFIYGRVARAPQGVEAAAEQLLKCKAYAADQGLVVVAQAVDAPGSGLSDARPGFAALLGAVESGGVEFVLVTELDRISRDVRALDYVLRSAAKTGVRVVAIGRSDTDRQETRPPRVRSSIH